ENFKLAKILIRLPNMALTSSSVNIFTLLAVNLIVSQVLSIQPAIYFEKPLKLVAPIIVAPENFTVLKVYAVVVYLGLPFITVNENPVYIIDNDLPEYESVIKYPKKKSFDDTPPEYTSVMNNPTGFGLDSTPVVTDTRSIRIPMIPSAPPPPFEEHWTNNNISSS
ncbi:unnamed protein product, partial [Didymodactylos carnosus]